jgi:hypothetical protein
VRTKTVALGCLMAAWFAVLWPADAEAQRYRGYRGRGYARFYYPAFYPSFYYPGFGFGFTYSPFWYPWSYYGPYPYAPYWFDDSSDLRIQVTPREAEVYVDGRFAGHVDDYDGVFQRLRVEPGGHEITLYHERYRPVTEKLYLSPRAGYKIQRAMEPLGPGEPAPPRPAPSAEAPEPERRMRPGPGPYAPAPGRGQSQRETRAEGFGTLAIRVQPADAEVFVDGERWRSPDSTNRLVLELSDGAHRVEIRKDGHQPDVSTVRVRAGETATLNVSLPPR